MPPNLSAEMVKAFRLLHQAKYVEAYVILSQIRGVGMEEAPMAARYLAHIEILRNNYVISLSILKGAEQDFGEDYKNLSIQAELYMGMGDGTNAVRCARRALDLYPDNQVLALNLAVWQSSEDQTPSSVRTSFEGWSSRYLDPLAQSVPPLPVTSPLAGRRIKIGYVSGDLKNHAVRYLIEPYLRLHDSGRFEVHAFMTQTEDEVSQILKSYVPHWHQVGHLSNPDLLALIRGLGIDVLIDLSGHTAGDRLEVFAMRAAPLQLTWWGFMQTLGMRAMDFRITDSTFCPPGADGDYTEGILRLACMTAYQPPVNCETQYESPWRKNGFVTMVSLNHTRKISDEALQLWGRVLHTNPQSGLMIISSEATQEGADAQMSARLVRASLPLDRVVVVPRLPMLDFMNLAAVSDFALDSMPISGGVTTFHALWMGLPVLTLDTASSHPLQSYASNILRTIGMSACIATDEKKYLELACEWISKPELIDELRYQSREKFITGPYMCHDERIRDLELNLIEKLKS